MRISGLSNQWETKDGLLESLAPADADPVFHERSRVIRELFSQLETSEGPDLWIGTSHRLMHIVRRDTTHQFDRIPTFLTVEAVIICRSPALFAFRIGFSLTGATWEYQDVTQPKDACRIIARLAQQLSA
jgi:hypothetical protein